MPSRRAPSAPETWRHPGYDDASVTARTATALECLVTRDRLWVLAGVVGATGLAWLYLFSMTTGMEAMGEAMLSARATPWTWADFLLMFLMWAIMMVGMMLPSATPMILLFATVTTRRRSQGEPGTPPGIFASGYIAAWSAFSLAATILQWGLHRAGLLSPMMSTTSALLGGTVLVAAGIYQWTPFKTSCLRHCQSPLHFISTHWRNGTVGAFRMGWTHGLYCLGCCWVLMCLLFVGGIMNLLWIAGLAVFVLVEKVWPHRFVPLLSGAGLVIWGGLVVAGGF